MTTDPRHQDQPVLDIDQAELRGFARSVANVEWLLLILVMLFFLVTDTPIANREMFIITLLGFAVFVLAFRYTAIHRRRTRLKLSIETLVMVAFVTAVLAQTNEENSPLQNLYLLPIITSALTQGKAVTILNVALVCVCYVFLGQLQSANMLSLAYFSKLLGGLSPYLLVAFLTTLLADNIQRAKQRIRALSDKDGLTGVYNMRAFTGLVGREHNNAVRRNQPYSLLMVDVDRLKEINDIHGHEAGNRAILLVADALLRITRTTDLVARYGGDEFIVFLSEADAEATFPDDAAELQGLILAADQAMYSDKELRKQPEGKLVIHKR